MAEPSLGIVIRRSDREPKRLRRFGFDLLGAKATERPTHFHDSPWQRLLMSAMGRKRTLSEHVPAPRDDNSVGCGGRGAGSNNRLQVRLAFGLHGLPHDHRANGQCQPTDNQTARSCLGPPAPLRCVEPARSGIGEWRRSNEGNPIKRAKHQSAQTPL